MSMYEEPENPGKKNKKTKAITPMGRDRLPPPLVRALVEIYYDFQGQRIITGNRIAAQIKTGSLTKEQLETYGINTLFQKAEAFENDIKVMLGQQVPLHPVFNEHLRKIYGIGPVLAAGLMAYVGDVAKFDNISRLWSYAGFGMNSFCPKCNHYTWAMVEFTRKDGKKTKAKRFAHFYNCPECGEKTVPMIQRRQTGYVSNWNDNFKVLVWKIGQSVLKQQPKNSYYRRMYDKFKEEEERKHPERIVDDNDKVHFTGEERRR